MRLSAAASTDRSPPSHKVVMGRARSENFPVVSRLLDRATRADLLALYGYARLVDELGDAYTGDRLAALDWVQSELELAYTGQARNPVLAALQPTIERHALPVEPLIRIIEANRLDQRQTRYETWDELRAYCHLSADPVGELVLDIFGVRTPRRVELSDRICTALQLLEHLQDITEDLQAGRIYLPASEMNRFGVTETDLRDAQAGVALRALIAAQVSRANTLLCEGQQLTCGLPWSARTTISGFIAGGRANLRAIANAHYDVLGCRPRARRAQILLSVVPMIARGCR